jgi:prepilin-type N-terminal cleavage/methylation domain-containing protein
MGCAHKQNQSGFTLVEISIVMIIIGLLIGGVFAGRTLVETARINKVVQQLTGVQTASISFKDIYGTWPGDLRNPSTRISGCTALPCSRTGNGNRTVDAPTPSPIDAADHMAGEGFVFWHHLQKSELITLKMTGENNVNFGRGQPSMPIFNGMSYGLMLGNPFPAPLPANPPIWRGYLMLDAVVPQVAPFGMKSCRIIARIDQKIDDGNAYAPTGKVYGRGCQDFGPNQARGYNIAYTGYMLFDLKGF